MAITLVNIGTGVRTGDGDALRLAFSEVNTSLTDLDTRLKTNTALLGTLGAAAFLNVGATPGSVADGGALAAEIIRATAAEQANTTAITAEVSRAQSAEALKAPIASPTFTGIPRAPTATAGTGGTQIATLDFVATAVAAGGGGGGGGGGGVPPTRQILAFGLATGGGDLTADRTITVTAASQSDVATGTDQTKALTPFSIAAALGAKAPLASPALVGTPTAPTASAGTNTTQIATTAFVTSAVGNVQRTAYRFVATQGQTTFSGADAAGLTLAYTAGLVAVFVNGRRLSPPDFTAPDGTGVYIPSGVNAGDEVLIIADAAFSVANTYTQAQVTALIASVPVQPPQGRLTLASGVPVMSSAVSGAVSVIYTPYISNLIPISNGLNDVTTTFSEVSQALSDTTKSPSAAAAGNVYDLFAWNDGGTFRVTRGPAWSAGTSGSNTVRGTGAGSTALTRVNGFLRNAVSITNGPGANLGTYVGTIATDSGGATVTFNPGSAAAGGGAAIIGLWNAYNRVTVSCVVKDTTTNWSYATAAWRASNASFTNRVTFVSGSLDDPWEGLNLQYFSGSSSAGSATSIGLNSATAVAPNAVIAQQSSVGGNAAVTAQTLPSTVTANVQGLNYLQAIEFGGTGALYYGNGVSGFTVRGRY